jgi:hypothetical protein
MPIVYLKGGETVEVSLEDLKRFLDENRSRLETRQIEAGRRRIKQLDKIK